MTDTNTTTKRPEDKVLADTWKGITVNEAKDTLRPITERILKGFDDIATTQFDIGRLLAQVSDTGIYTAASHSMAKRDWKPKGRRSDFSVYYQTVLGLESAEVGRLMDAYRVGAAEVALGLVEHGSQVTASHVRELAPVLKSKGQDAMAQVITMAEESAAEDDRAVVAEDLKTARKVVAPPAKRSKGGDTFAQGQAKTWKRHAAALADTTDALPVEALVLITAAEVDTAITNLEALKVRVNTATESAAEDAGKSDAQVQHDAA